MICRHPSRPDVYAGNFLRQLRTAGPYDIVHSHVHHYSGFVLKLARRAGIAGRIAHSHSDTSRIQHHAWPTRKLYYALTRGWIRRHATLGLAASAAAAVALFGADWETKRRCEVLFCGIDLTPFQTPTDRAAVRAELCIPHDAFLIGHVGRFVPLKNHAFLVNIASALATTDPGTHLLLVGEGPMRPAIEAQVARSPMAGRVRFAGARSDVPRLLGALDAFVFPSHYEGLGLAAVEAQAAGVPCVISDSLPREADAIPRLIRRLGLSQPATAWAEAVRQSRKPPGDSNRTDSWRDLSGTAFDIRTSAQRLEDRYRGAPGRVELEPASLP